MQTTHLSMKYKIVWAGMFAICMGYFEAALVEYLRELYYPEGFSFPLKSLSLRLGIIEIGREAVSIGMLFSVACISSRIRIDRFATFCFCFGVWDISYYLFLKLFENWPHSLATTDILFLIPAPWVGPVWAPVAVSIALIWAAIHIWVRLDNGIIVKPKKYEWFLAVLSGLIIISSFLFSAPAALKQENLPEFPWYITVIGLILGIVIFMRALDRQDKIENR